MSSDLPQYVKDARTKREIEFLQHVGSYSRIKIPRPVLQKRYRDSMHLRYNWDGIDHVEVAAYLDKTI